MRYTELKEEISKEVNGFPIKFAFSDEQFERGLQELEASAEQVVSIGGGGFIRKTDREAFSDMFAQHNERMKKALLDDDFLMDAIEYELANHGYCINHDTWPALLAIGINEKDIDERVQRCFQEAKRRYLDAVSWD